MACLRLQVGLGNWTDCGSCGKNYGADLIACFSFLEEDYGKEPEELPNQ